MTKRRWSVRIGHALMQYGPMLPLTLIESERRTVRVLGLLYFLVWAIPLMAMLLPFAVVSTGIQLIEDLWHGDF